MKSPNSILALYNFKYVNQEVFNPQLKGMLFFPWKVHWYAGKASSKEVQPRERLI